MAKIWVGPTGQIVTGTVLDCNKQSLELALKHYDPQLYIKWNPRKRAGMGLWEIRRRPEKKSVIPYVEYKGVVYSKIDYVEEDMVHHVMDAGSLTYAILTELKKMDTWAKGFDRKSWAAEYEFKEKQREQALHDKRREELRYHGKQFKKEIRDLKEAILSGLDPNRIADHWGK